MYLQHQNIPRRKADLAAKRKTVRRKKGKQERRERNEGLQAKEPESLNECSGRPDARIDQITLLQSICRQSPLAQLFCARPKVRSPKLKTAKYCLSKTAP